jgi:tetraacyldisaccharide 4'-kinase
MRALRPGIERIMRGEGRDGLLAAPLQGLSYAYGAAIRLRALAYSSGVVKATELPFGVISVGNITVGGTGKTPVTILLADILMRQGLKVAILSRGYGGTVRGVGVVSDGGHVLLGPVEAGDEPYLMATRLRGVPVVVGPDRVVAGLEAGKRFSPDCVILDDGFQHIRLKRDVNILLVDSAQGFGNGYLLPRGILREPVDGIRRADAVMVKGGPLGKREEDALRASGLPVLRFDYRARAVYDLRGATRMDAASLRGRKVAALAGIANPESFFATLRGLGAMIVKALPYPDHHVYTAADMADIRRSIGTAEVLVTTEKDGVRLDLSMLGSIPVHALSVDAVVEDAGRLSALLALALRRTHAARHT